MLSKRVYLLRLLTFRSFLGFVILACFLFGYWHWLAYQEFLRTPIDVSDNKQILTIKRGDSVNLLARRWQKKGMIENQFYLRLYCELNPGLKNIKSGEYQLAEKETPVSLMEKLFQGQVIQYAFTIIEGMNSYQVLDAVKNVPFLENDLANNQSILIKSLGISSQNVEGWLFPDTYYFTKADSATRLLKRAAIKMQQVLEEEWQKRDPDLPYEMPYQALIMASIIEKETALESERQQIAGVFVRRLQKKMRLQTDPTVIYGIGPDFNGDITFKDLRKKTPYNTYVIKGLPPTPIAMPGRESIFAALHPAKGNALYFVATGDGGHYFSASLEEHNRAVRRLLKQRAR